MGLCRSMVFYASIVFSSITIVGLSAADVPTDCLALFRGAACSVLSGVPALCCCGTTTVGVMCGAATCSCVACVFCYPLSKSEWIDGVQTVDAFMNFDDGGYAHHIFPAPKLLREVSLVWRSTSEAWMYGMDIFMRSELRHFVVNVVSIVMSSVSADYLPLVKRIAFGYAIANLLEPVKQRSPDLKIFIASLDAEVAFLEKYRKIVPEIGAYLRRMSEAFVAYKGSWGRASAAFEVLAAGDKDLLAFWRKALSRQSKKSRFRLPQQKMD